MDVAHGCIVVHELREYSGEANHGEKRYTEIPEGHGFAKVESFPPLHYLGSDSDEEKVDSDSYNWYHGMKQHPNEGVVCIIIFLPLCSDFAECRVKARNVLKGYAISSDVCSDACIFRVVDDGRYHDFCCCFFLVCWSLFVVGCVMSGSWICELIVHDHTCIARIPTIAGIPGLVLILRDYICSYVRTTHMYIRIVLTRRRRRTISS